MKGFLIISLTLLLFFPAKSILAQDSLTIRQYDYAILSLVGKAKGGGGYGRFIVQYDREMFEDLSKKLKLPEKMPVMKENPPVPISYYPLKVVTLYNACLIRCFNYLNGRGFEFVCFNNDEYVFRRSNRKGK